MTRRIMPEDLVVGVSFRLTGDAEDPNEAADTNLYEVMSLDAKYSDGPGRPILVGLVALVRIGEGAPFPMRIGPWVPLLLVVDSSVV